MRHDIRCNNNCDSIRVCDTIRRDHERLTELFAYRAASFFDQVRAAGDDIAVNGTPGMAITVPLWQNGHIIGRERAVIVRHINLDMWLVRFDDGTEQYGFGPAMRLAR